jgi:hypothetical protein
VVNSTAPLGVAAYAGLASNFPLAQFMGSVASRMQRPYTSLLLDFHRMLVWDNATMFTDGPVGERTANPRHLAALARFADAYLDATAATRADSASLLIFVLNGPDGRGERWKSNLTRVAYSMPPAELNEALCTDSAVRAELASFIRAVVGVLAPRVAKGLQIRLTGMLEDNLNRRGALALQDVVVRLGGWPWAYGRNVCPGCTPEIVADASRVGTYWEKHINHEQDMPALLALHQPFDGWSNDGWLGDISVSVSVDLLSRLRGSSTPRPRARNPSSDLDGPEGCHFYTSCVYLSRFAWTARCPSTLNPSTHSLASSRTPCTLFGVEHH